MKSPVRSLASNKMRLALAIAGIVTGLAAPLPAQTTNAAPAMGEKTESLRDRAIGFLPQADQDRVSAAYHKALVDNPALKTEGDALMKEAPDVRGMSSQDRMAFMEKRRMHDQKMREAMLKEDPTLGPALDQIDKHLSAMRAERQKAMNTGSAAP